MSDTINTCSICELIKYYLLHWKFDMTCSTCGRIWKLPISPAKKESKRKAIGKKEIEMSQEEMKQLKRTRRLSLRDSDTKRKRKSHLLKSELKQELQPELIRTKTGQKLERTKLEDENVTILCPNDWCSHQHRIARPRVPNALLTMKRHQKVCQEKHNDGLRFNPKFNANGNVYGRYISIDGDDQDSAALATPHMIKQEQL